MANGKMRGRPRKTTNQGVENSKIQQIRRTFLKRKIDSDEHDKNDPSTPLPPKRQSLCNNAANCNSDVCKSEVCIKSSGNISSPRKGEFKRRLFGVENRNSWRTRYLRSMGKVANCLELPNAMRGNGMTRKNSHANSSGSKKYDKQSLADSPPDTCNEMHIEQSKMDMSKAELADNEEIFGPIVETEATLYTPDSTDKHSSSDCADLFALQQVFTPSTTEQNGVSFCRSSPENVDHDILTPEVFGNGSAYAENPSLSPSAAQIALSCKSDMTILAAGSIAGRLPETQYKVENCESMNVGSPNVFQDHSGDSPEQLTSQGPDRKEPVREAIMLREHGDIGECEESDCKRIRLSNAFQPSGMHSSAGKGQAFILKSLTTVEICQDEKEVNKGSGATSEMTVLEPKEQCKRSEDCKSNINQVSPVLHVSQPKVRSGPPSDGTLSPTTRQLRSHISKLGASPANLATNLESMQKDVSVSKNQPLWNSTKIKLKLKMPEKIMVDKVPSSVKALLLTGLLEGCSVRYLGRAEKVMLTGVIRGAGVLCSCNLCKGKQVVSICNFEEHAGSTARHASDFIVLENGRSLRDVLEEGKGVEPGNFPDVIRKATDSSNRGFRACRKCRVPLDQSNQGKSNLLCQTCDPNLQSQPKVETTPIVRRRGRPRLLDQKVEQKLQTKLLTKTSPNLKVREKPSVQLQTKAPQKDMMLHKIIFKPHGLPDGTKLAYYVKGQRLLDGHKQGFGIFCSCCKTVLSCSQFEAHAGRASRRNPYNSIYLADGQSLHELAVSLTRQNANIDENEDYCTECGDGGDLVCCDGCPRAFHKECVGLSCVPRGKYYCSYCPQQCGRGRKLNGKEPKTAGKSVRVGSLEKPSNRCTRVVKAPEKTVGGCVLCRREDFEKNGFGDRTVMLCDQCEKEFHVGCLREHSMADLKELPQDEWFCSNDCKTIHSALQKLVEHGPKPIPKELMKKPIDKDVEEQSSTQINWQLLYGKRRDPDKRELLSEAAAIFAECFDPIIDPVTGRDLIPSMVYSRSVRDQEFGGMYCAVLTVDSVVVSAGVFRIFGRQVAELPLVATSPKSQGQGYFQALFSGIERLLGFLNVENLVLPAAEEAESLWINKFGFTNMSDEQLYMYRKDLQIMSFQGNAMLEKPLSSLSSVHAGPNKGP